MGTRWFKYEPCSQVFVSNQVYPFFLQLTEDYKDMILNNMESIHKELRKSPDYFFRDISGNGTMPHIVFPLMGKVWALVKEFPNNPQKILEGLEPEKVIR